MAGDSDQYPLENFRAFIGRGTAGFVSEGHDAVDTGKVAPQRLRGEASGHELRDTGRTVHRRNHCHVVPRAGAAARASEALEGESFRLGQEWPRGGGFQKMFAGGQFTGVQVVHMHMGSGRDVHRSPSDKLSVLANRGPLGQRPERDLVGSRD